MDTYFPQSLKDFKENEFFQLKHGNMSPTDYERKFNQLSRYAPHPVDIKIKKTRRFEQGLNPNLSMILISHHLLERTHAIGIRRKMQSNTINCTISKTKDRLERENGMKKVNNNDQNKKGKARVFTMNQKDAEENSNVIAGILLISDTPAYVLFDSGATHSFISTSFIAKSSINCDKSKSTLEVSISSGRTLNIDQFARLVNLKIEGKTFEANLYMIEMKDLDVILGMNWLGYNYATIR
ncbi:uncharacterized protein LOC111400270 [Olea europaea var. sylvestris]|uniref:uncharacterized protein LOC111400270 n=1 Tax=Olea europaea var. sylvestris TaxID=158386 RepID=UPI000C1CF156|nr:uncharacterized protein LOC111400270 [Olea europaea var. sylvestris]